MVIKWRGFPYLLSNLRACQRNGFLQCNASQIQKLSFDNGLSGELTNDHRNPDDISVENRIFGASDAKEIYKDTAQRYPCRNDKITRNGIFIDIIEVTKEVSKFIGENPKWEDKLLKNFPSVNFVNPSVYKWILRSESNVSLSLRLYYWLSSLNGFLFDAVLYNMIFKRLVKANVAHYAKKLIDDTGFEPEPNNLELYVRCLCKAGSFEEVIHVIKRLREIDYSVSHSTWTLALSCSVEAGRGDILCKLQEEMVESGVETDMSTIGCNIQAFCLENNAVKAYELLRQVMDAGHFPARIFVNKLISALCKCGDFGKASAVLHHMIANGLKLDIYNYQVIIHELCKQGRIYEGFIIFNELKRRGYSPDIVMYTTLIHALCREKKVKNAHELWIEMINEGITANEHSYNALLDGLWKNGCVHEAEKLHKEMLEKGYGETTATYNTMIYGLCFSGKVEEAHVLFGEMNEKGIIRDHVTYSVLINGFIQQGKTIEAVFVLYDSLKKGIKPSTSSLAHLVTQLCKDGYLEEANALWKDMHKIGLKPPYLYLEPLVFELSKQEKFSGAIECLCYMINNNYKPTKALLELVESIFDANQFDCAYFIHSYLLKMGFLLDGIACHDIVENLDINSLQMEQSLCT